MSPLHLIDELNFVVSWITFLSFSTTNYYIYEDSLSTPSMAQCRKFQIFEYRKEMRSEILGMLGTIFALKFICLESTLCTQRRYLSGHSLWYITENVCSVNYVIERVVLSESMKTTCYWGVNEHKFLVRKVEPFTTIDIYCI